MASSATVTVGCKLPHGFHLDLHEVVNGQPEVKARYTVEGANASQIIGGHGITPNVPEDFWNEWLAKNKNTPMVRNGLIFANTKASEVVARAQGQEDLATGFEGVDAEKLPAGIEKADKK